jgi:rhamnogalacturonan acetylesterase
MNACNLSNKFPKVFQKASKRYFFILAVLLLFAAWKQLDDSKPVVYIIGDSTVQNGGNAGIWGWGNMIPAYFDTLQIAIENRAIGGRSSRTFITDGRWDRILTKLKKGDYVIMQFGHNDGNPLADSSRARGTIKGIGNESREIYNPIKKKQEIVYTYGWYMRKYITETKAKGAIPIVCSPVPRNMWKEGKVIRDSTAYTLWASQVAKQESSLFINLNEIVCDKYDKLGEASVKGMFTSKDRTHTSKQGAQLNAASVVEGIKSLKDCTLSKYILASEKVSN